MYSIYVDNGDATNKGTFSKEFDPPIEFSDGDTVALTSLSMYNTIYNISEFIPNNKFYFYRTDNADLNGNTSASVTGIQNGSAGSYLYTATLPNGQYTVENIDTFLAKCFNNWDSENNKLKDYNLRSMAITPDVATSRFNIVLKSNYDVLFKVDDVASTNLAYLMGFDMKKDTLKYQTNVDTGDYTTVNSFDYWSLIKYRSNHAGRAVAENGYQVAEILNGLRTIHIKLKNNVIFGGYDSISNNSDSIFGFAFSKGAGSIEVFNPTNPVYLTINAVMQSLGRLDFDITDQNGKSLNQNIGETMSFTLTVNNKEVIS